MMKVVCNFVLLALIILLTCSVSCKVEDEIPIPITRTPEVSIHNDWIWDVTRTTAFCIGWVSTDSSDVLIETTGICWSKDSNPTINDSKTINESGEIISYNSISGLTPDTRYYVRAYAIWTGLTNYGTAVPFVTQGGSENTVTDIDGNVYNIVKIGLHWWMASNLKTDHYNNGDTIPTGGDWFSLSTGAYCLYTCIQYILPAFFFCRYISDDHMYNFPAVADSRGICPAGWHVPTDYEWKLLEGYADSQFPQGDPEWDKEGWRGSDAHSNLMATWGWGKDQQGNDQYGFSALPAGRSGNNLSEGHGNDGYFWTSTEGIYRIIANYGVKAVYRGHEMETGSWGMSVRCVKEDGSNTFTPCPAMPTVTYEEQTYNTVQVGDQCWLRENLNVGTIIQADQEMTDNGVIEKYCYNDDPGLNADYGGLYQWREAMQYDSVAGSRGICPPGWHIPSDQEWTILVNFAGGVDNAGSQLKEAGLMHWNPPNTGAINGTGFNALPGGFRSVPHGAFYLLGSEALFWSSTKPYPGTPDYWCLFNDSDNAGLAYREQENGLSVRCIKD